jgi:hypothetical protein
VVTNCTVNDNTGTGVLLGIGGSAVGNAVGRNGFNGLSLAEGGLVANTSRATTPTTACRWTVPAPWWRARRATTSDSTSRSPPGQPVQRGRHVLPRDRAHVTINSF